MKIHSHFMVHAYVLPIYSVNYMNIISIYTLIKLSYHRIVIENVPEQLGQQMIRQFQVK